MPIVWRTLTAKHAATAFSGEGARLHGGRWNSQGVPMVYTASTLSLATLEMLVQDGKLLATYVVIPATIPSKLKIEHVNPNDLPEDWRSAKSREKLRAIGAGWIKRASSAVLAVPSAVIPTETNYLLNPLHPSFQKIVIGAPQEFETDLRLPRK
ncbi:RES family NAD+ phosphorylase [Thiobacillus sp.]